VTQDHWRAVDHDGEVLESIVAKAQDRKAALESLTKAMRRPGRPQAIVTDKLRSCGAALKDPVRGDEGKTGRRIAARAGNPQLPFRRRGRAMVRFRRMRRLQQLAQLQASTHNHASTERNLQARDTCKMTRAAALARWRGFLAA
jgi:putative transposase